MDRAERKNAGKPPMSFNTLGIGIQELEAEVWADGAVKYSRGQWLKGMPLSEALDSLQRHINKFSAGQDLDTGDGGSGLTHVGHIICCAKILAQSYILADDENGFDDRPDDPSA